MNYLLVAWAIGVPLFAVAASLVALANTRRDANAIRALEQASKHGGPQP